MSHKKPLIIAIDMDGTITAKSFPKIGEPLPEAFAVMKELQAQGHRLVLWTCRENEANAAKSQHLDEAVGFCRQQGIEFVSVNENRVDGFPPLKGRKIFADVYIDDKNLGGFPGWEKVREMILGQPAGEKSANGFPRSDNLPHQGPHFRIDNGWNGNGNDNGHHSNGHGNGNGHHGNVNGHHSNGHGNGNGSPYMAAVLEKVPATANRMASTTRWPERRTRIVATLGPATDRPGVLEAILGAGVNVARINLSHGMLADTCERVTRLRQVAKSMGRQVAVLADLPGPKLRAILKEPLALHQGREITLAISPHVTADIHVTEPIPLGNVEPGNLILLDDGRLQLRALRIEDGRLVTQVLVGGTLLPKKGVNLPGTHLGIPALTTRDREGLAIAAAAKVDWLGLSFVREPEAAEELRQAAREHGLNVPVLAKIELPEAVNRAQEIIEAFDGVMMDRGDLGSEIPLEYVPRLQKQLIGLARAMGKPFITATDMLDSMCRNPRPTRAESNDVANAIYDGTDAVMLSGETAAGQYPIEAVAYMDRIARETEMHLADDNRDMVLPHGQIVDRITQITCTLAREVQADVIIAPTHSGHTPRLVARHRPKAAIVAPTPNEGVARMLAMVWGVQPVTVANRVTPGEDWLELAVKAAFAHGAVHEGDLAVGVAGHLVEGGKKAPTVRVVRVGENGCSCAP